MAQIRSCGAGSLRRWCLLLGALSMVLSPGARAHAQNERLVLATYFAWYDWSTWAQSLPDQPLELYTSSSGVTLENHVLQARSAGIDALVLAWLGPTLVGNPTEPGLRVLLDEAAAHGLRVAAMLYLDGDSLRTATEVTEALVALRDGHAVHAAYLRVSEHPVVFFYRQSLLSLPIWEAIRNQVDPQREMLWVAEGMRADDLAVFDGLYLYNVAESPDPVATLSDAATVVHDWNAAQGQRRYWVATAMPGFDNSALGSGDLLLRDRAGGAFYRACWDGAVQTEADWVLISSFNQWLEGSQIEPSVTYGDEYLLLTAQEADEYRNGTLALSPTPPQPTATESAVAVEVVTWTPTSTTVASTAPVTQETSTPLPEPSATLRPVPTPLRLPTPTLGPPMTITPLQTPLAGWTTAAPPGGSVQPTSTRIPRFPVEGTRPTQTCFLGPAALPLMVAVLVWRRRVSR